MKLCVVTAAAAPGLSGSVGAGGLSGAGRGPTDIAGERVDRRQNDLLEAGGVGVGDDAGEVRPADLAGFLCAITTKRAPSLMQGPMAGRAAQSLR